MSDLAWMSIAELAPRLRRREVSPVEVLDAVLARTAALEPRLNTYITLMADEARACARAAAAEMAAGGWRGPLHGIPLGVKDLFEVAGAPTTFGSAILRDNLTVRDAAAIARLRKAGAVFTGKQNLEEFAFGLTSNNPHYGPVRNPWDTRCIPGGSSGGTAAGIAAGLCYGGLGSDTGGSIRNPAALCGVAGIKPTYGRVSRAGALPLAWTLDHVGPLARTVMDCALLLEVLADPAAGPVPAYSAGLTGDVRDLRVGVVKEYFPTYLDDGVRQAVDAALRHLEGQGARMVEVSVPLAEHSQAILSPIISSEAASWHARWLRERPRDYGAPILARLQLGALFPAAAYLKGQRLRRELQRQFALALTQANVLVSAAVPVPAPALGQDKVTVGNRDMEARAALNRLTCPANLTGMPAAAVPCGFSGHLPVGLQVMGRPWDEVTVLRVAHAYEQTTPWHRQRPPL